MNRLTDVHYWEDQRPERLKLYRDFDLETVNLLRQAAGRGPAWVLEVGARRSRVLPYLSRKFRHRVFGSDFSLLLRAGPSLERLEGGVVCEDLFQSSLPAEAFDLVYSSGLIEHFDDIPAVVAEHLRPVRPGGQLVLIVPNLQGVQGRITERLAPSLWSLDKVLGPDDRQVVLKQSGLNAVRSGYLGSFPIRIMRGKGWAVVDRWPVYLEHLVEVSLRLMNALVSLAFRLSPLRPHSRSLSPALFVTGTKPAA